MASNPYTNTVLECSDCISEGLQQTDIQQRCSEKGEEHLKGAVGFPRNWLEPLEVSAAISSACRFVMLVASEGSSGVQLPYWSSYSMPTTRMARGGP